MATVANLEEIIEKGLAPVRERILIEAAYLFGSPVSGEADQDSDIDLAIFAPAVDGLNLFERVRLISEWELGCDSGLELHLFSCRALANARPANFAGYIVAHGQRLI
jgi:predicted nucleotidyltransferase